MDDAARESALVTSGVEAQERAGVTHSEFAVCYECLDAFGKL